VFALGFAAASLTTLGLYPVGQVFQVREDRSRGDRTLAVALGPARALRLGMAVLLLAGVSAVSLMALRYRSIDVAVLAGAYAASIWQLGRFAKTFERGEATVGGAFATSMRLTYLTSGAFLLFIAGHWVAI
jgi:4-hydroxybenzoate polyprenyltransferase